MVRCHRPAVPHRLHLRPKYGPQSLAPGDRNGAHRLLAGGCGDLPWRLVSCPRNSMYIVAIKMGRRLGKRVGGSVYGRIGVWGTKTAFRHDYDDQEVSKKLTTLCKRRHADSPTRRYVPPSGAAAARERLSHKIPSCRMRVKFGRMTSRSAEDQTGRLPTSGLGSWSAVRTTSGRGM